MNITIISVGKISSTNKSGKPYTTLLISFSNNTFQGKIETKKLTPYGENAATFKALENAQGGQSFEIKVVKNDAGFNDWIAAVPSEPSAEQTAPSPATPQAYQPKAAPAPAGNNSRGFETPEERAKKQTYIVRQSSLSNAIAALSVGSKTPLKLDDVTAYAQGLVDYVLGIAEVKSDSGFDDMDSDVPL